MTDPRPDELGPAIPPASEQPVEAIGAGREEIADIIALHVSGPSLLNGEWKEAHRKDQLHAADLILAALSPASPARTPMGEPQVLKGVGKINGDGWKDTTSIGEVVYVWNAEKPSPYAPGQYPRIDNEGWSASTAQYDFSPASVDEVRALAAPTPMGGDREHSSRCWGRTSFSDEVLHCYCQTAPTPMGVTVEENYTPERSRERLLAAMSAAGAAVTGIAETLRVDGGVEDTLEAGIGWTDQDAFLPLQEDVLEPLIDALRLTIHAIGLPDPTHRISLALDAFTRGED